jgi:hypothetical protein
MSTTSKSRGQPSVAGLNENLLISLVKLTRAINLCNKLIAFQSSPQAGRLKREQFLDKKGIYHIEISIKNNSF